MPDEATIRAATRDVVLALERCPEAIDARSMAYRATRDGYLPEASAHAVDAAEYLLAANPELRERVTARFVVECIAGQVFALLNGDLQAIDKPTLTN